MAQKRMFDKIIVRRDDFIEMSDSAQNLYFQLSMDADDDGFVDNWKSIMKMTGAKEDDLKLLIFKRFILPFQSGIIVIRHWRLNNYLRKDRYTETRYLNEKKQLNIDENNEYNFKENQLDLDCGLPTVYTDKKRIEENRSSSNINNKENAFELLEKNFARTFSPIEIDTINYWINKLNEDLVIEAIKIATNSNKKTVRYIEGILNNWKLDGMKKVGDIKNNNSKEQQEEAKDEELFDYNWLEDKEREEENDKKS